jgi:site-specific DNA-methyltransferase (adenine-specific)
MKPYYQENGITIYHADCRDVLHLIGRPECLLTDPVWGIDGGSGHDARVYKKGIYTCDGWSDTQEYVRAVVVPVIEAALLVIKRGAVTPGIRCLMDYPRPADMGCFYSPAASKHGPWGFTTFSPILYYGKDYRAGKGAIASSRTVTEAAEPNGHPCPKPLGAWKWLLSKISQSGETVVDPFMGSGTTLRAAKDLGVSAIGIEIEEQYCEIAARRMSQSVLNFAEMEAGKLSI